MLIIGTRGSSLARSQASWVEGMILAQFPDTRIVVKIIRTSADKDTVTAIRSGSATGVFVKEIEEALLAREIDLAVHSMKDLPTRIPEGLEIGAIPVREDARDAIIAGAACSRLQDLPAGATIGTGSIRRQAQILALRPDLTVKDIRGSIETRLQKLASGGYEAIILACAGLNRLGLQHRISLPLQYSEMLPAPGQGALALEIRRGDGRVATLIAGLNDPPTASAVLAERAFLRRLEGGCNSPVAVHAHCSNDSCTVEGLVAAPDGSRMVRDAMDGPPSAAREVAKNLADRILSRGGAEILRSPH